jgi:hypothetical protein
MHLPQSVIDQVKKDFAPDAQDEVLDVLTSYGIESYEREKERVLLAVLDLAKGSRDAVRDYVNRAKRDYRDVLFWSEYPEESRLDTPEKIDRFQKLCKWLGVDLGVEWKSPKE